MMKRFSKKENLGITLIALVITVIILLILAGITINTLSNSGIFEKAKEAKEKWQNTQNEEEMQLAKYSNEIDNYVASNRNQTSNSFEMTQLTDICGGTTWQKTDVEGGIDQYRYLYLVYCYNSESIDETYNTLIIETSKFKNNTSHKVRRLFFAPGSGQYCYFYYDKNNNKDEIYISSTNAAYGGYVCGIK